MKDCVRSVTAKKDATNVHVRADVTQESTARHVRICTLILNIHCNQDIKSLTRERRKNTNFMGFCQQLHHRAVPTHARIKECVRSMKRRTDATNVNVVAVTQEQTVKRVRRLTLSTIYSQSFQHFPYTGCIKKVHSWEIVS